MKIKLICLSIFFIITSCETSDEIIFSKLQGSWAIYELIHNKTNYRDSLNINTFFIDKNKEISLPEMSNFNEETTNKWDFVIDNNDEIILNLNCNNKIFRGKYKVEFIKNPKRKLLGIILESDQTKIIAYKFLQDYKINGIGW